MIRFIDKVVYSVVYEELNRSELRSYFPQGNRKEIICVFDAVGSYKGQITYPSLQQIWDKGRDFFRKNRSSFGGEILLPVLDEARQLICFAYQDEEANRELRMLRELEENDELKDFRDLFPFYDLVKINGLYELAYYFAKYLYNR